MNLTDSSIENTIKPLPVEPAEKDWGVGVNAMGDTHSPLKNTATHRRSSNVPRPLHMFCIMSQSAFFLMSLLSERWLHR